MTPLFADWTRRSKAYVRAVLRRRADALLPSADTKAYQQWIEERLSFREHIFKKATPGALLSIVTAVWDGSPLNYLRALAESIAEQNQNGACEWVVLDNGCSNSKLKQYLEELASFPWVKLDHSQTNVGIVRGLRRCLEKAKGRYILPVDADDLLYPDALRVVSASILKHRYPALLYTDEDKINGPQKYQPYFKPDYDPVLLLNSAYIAHLGVIDRKRALKVGAYSDAAAEGSPDWDLFVRFLIAGEKAVHIPEIVYSWRVHATSTADDGARKSYIAGSQQRVIGRYQKASKAGELFDLEASPLFAGGDHWHLRRKQLNPKPYMTVVLSAGASKAAREYIDAARAFASEDGLICFLSEDLQIENSEWPWEAMGIAELHADVVMVGGRLWDAQGRIDEAGLELGFGEIYGSPNRGRARTDPGYFGQMWKQRSVGAVSTRFAAIRASFLVELLEHVPPSVSTGFLGAWAGAYASQSGKRVVYSPFLSGAVHEPLRTAGEEEKRLFKERYGALCDTRYYPAAFSRAEGFKLSPPKAKAAL